MGKTIVVLGGGTGGVATCNVLSSILKGQHQIILVDRSDTHIFCASMPLLLVNERQPQDICRNLHSLTQKGIDFFHTEVQSIEPAKRQITTAAGILAYDYLVISLGAEHHPETVPGQKEGAYNPFNINEAQRLQHQLAHMTKGKIVLFISHLPYMGVAAPWEIIFLLDQYFRDKNLRHQISLTLVTPEQTPLPIGSPQVGARLRRMMERRNINLVTQAKVLRVDIKTGHLILDGGIYIPGDLFIGIPSHWGPSALRSSQLTEDGGWLEVEPTTLRTRDKRIWGIGDAAGIRIPITYAWLPKVGIFAHYQGEVVARNIACQIAGKPPQFRFTGKAAGASIFVGANKAMLVSYDTFTPRGSHITLTRPSRAGYWAKIAFERYWLTRWF